jgi:chromosome segregation ATPase
MAVTERDTLIKAMGWDGSTTQQSSSSTLQSMSQDTGDAIEGRLTAIQIAVEAIRSNHQEQTLSIADLNDDLLSIIQTYNQFNVHYDNIERQMAKMYVELQTISENTGAIVKPIQNMETSLNRIESKVKYL